MKFYGVGVKLGAYTDNPIDILQECIDNNVWYMGFEKDVKPNYESVIADIQKGDVVFAKSLHQATKNEMKIKAIGIVTDEPMPASYSVNTGLSVLWIKSFSPPINLAYMNINFIENINRRNTVFLETDERIIEEINRIIKMGV
ncbi:hypothetical protein [Ruminococcus flavefaciens]|uniref:hypothetical protein n=1 Tax=Ruminococcus flavefaciens TaxID=1265 RepID=UPI0026EA6B39|nr:hypothetical protein [Ruminococcus flavefaciens]